MDSTTKKRIFPILFTIIGILLLIVVIKVSIIVISANQNNYTFADPQVANKVVRGAILDRNGNLLAIENTYTSCSFRVGEIDNLQDAASLASPYLDMSVDEILSQCEGHTYQALIKEKVKKDVIDSFSAAIKEAGYSGLIKLETFTGRDYPYTFHACQIIGFTGKDQTGLDGIEYALNDVLEPLPGLNEDITRGTDITVTLDMDIQYLTDLELQKIENEFKPKDSIAIVMDAQTGDILSVTNYPWYNPNDTSLSTETQRKNQSVSMLYEPGSVFKVFSLASIMDIGEANLTEPFVCDGSYDFTNEGQSGTINCHEPHGVVDPMTMIKKSCNGAISSWSLQTDDDAFYQKLCDFGFNEKVDLPLPGIARSRIASPSSWSFRSKPTISFGQELSTTAMNIVRAATVLANDGYRIEPQIILQENEGNIIPRAGEQIAMRTVAKSEQRIISSETATYLLQAMKGATEEGGTAIQCAVDGINVSAKTGTAQMYNEETHSYKDSKTLASTLAIVPTENPKYIIYVAARAPSENSIWGSNIAAPAVGNIIKGLISQGKLLTK